MVVIRHHVTLTLNDHALPLTSNPNLLDLATDTISEDRTSSAALISTLTPVSQTTDPTAPSISIASVSPAAIASSTPDSQDTDDAGYTTVLVGGILGASLSLFAILFFIVRVTIHRKLEAPASKKLSDKVVSKMKEVKDSNL
jgi:hypothetical protein